MISDSTQSVRSIYAIDLDNDTDMDVLSVSSTSGEFNKVSKIAWYENDGNQKFIDHAITDSATGANSVFACDMDSDTDIDIVLAADDLYWYENDGNQSFLEHFIRTDIFDSHYSVYATDIHNDKDIDILSAASFTDPTSDPGGTSYIIYFYENDGNHDFSKYYIAHFNELVNVNFLDMDMDDNIDILYAIPTRVYPFVGRLACEIGWYENIDTTTNIKIQSTNFPLEFHLGNNYPNPFNPKTTISYLLPKASRVDISIYNILGQKVITLVAEKQKAGNHNVVLDASRFASGVYFYRLVTDNGIIETKKMVYMR
jgi:hypothetical protein